MATINELMEGQTPGSITVVSGSIIFTPYFIDRANYWYGLSNTGHTNWFGTQVDRWELYVPPKQKVKMWKWLYVSGLTDRYVETETFYKETPAFNVIQRLDYTMIEVEI